MIAWWKAFWGRSGTKILGALGAFYSAVTGVVGLIAADPRTQIVIPPLWFAWLLIGNAVIHGFVWKRGFTNTRNANSPAP